MHEYPGLGPFKGSWRAKPSGRRDAQPKFSDLAIETALTLRLVFHLPLRQSEGFLRSLFKLMEVDLKVPDHTTLSRRTADLKVSLGRRTGEGSIDLIVDSSGLAVLGEGEWAAAKHGGKGRRGWKKLHLGVDAAGEIVAQIITNGAASDAPAGVDLINGLADQIASVIADAAYDARPVYRAAEAKGARVVVPPMSKASTTAWRRQPKARDQTIGRLKEIGRKSWKKESSHHRQGRAEKTFFRYKAIIGGRLRAPAGAAQESEAVLACAVLNRMRKLGWPSSEKIPC